jgi:hypothetical protein
MLDLARPGGSVGHHGTVERARRNLIKTGVDDFRAHRLEYFFPFVVSLVVVCAPLMFIGYVFDDEGRFGDSVGAGIGMLVGLAVWIILVVAFITTGAGQGWRNRRVERRRLARIEVRRKRREPRSAKRPSTE